VHPSVAPRPPATTARLPPSDLSLFPSRQIRFSFQDAIHPPTLPGPTLPLFFLFQPMCPPPTKTLLFSPVPFRERQPRPPRGLNCPISR